jgi:excinuclease ABC subunit C
MKKPANLPNNPGCYLFKNSEDRVVYVGKTKNLKKRVKNYFQKIDLDPKTQAMLRYAHSLDFVVTDSEVEAIILENTLIKKYQPKYNIRLKDAKSHTYLLLTKEEYPRLIIDRQKRGKGIFFGPFISAQERDYILYFLRRTFLLRTCNRLPKKACLRYHINLCDAPCIDLVSKNEYNLKIKKIKMILNSKSKQLLSNLEKEMKNYSDKKNYEKALKLRNEILAMEHLHQRQKMQREKRYNEDIINYTIKDDKVYLMLFNIYRGTLNNKAEYEFDYNDDFLEEFIIQYYSENPIPKEVIIPEKISDSIQNFLIHTKGSNVKVLKPQKGDKKQLLDLVSKNIEITFFSDVKKIDLLKNKLNLQESPNVIECFDISHLSGSSTVGSMVQFRNGKPYKSNYRRFRIRNVEGIDDFAAIGEIVRRRYKRLKEEDLEFPDLIIIDGGKGQLNFAISELEKLNLKIPIISIAKQLEEIYIPGQSRPIMLQKKDKVLQFIQEIRNEAHRFAIKYNRLLRIKVIRADE